MNRRVAFFAVCFAALTLSRESLGDEPLIADLDSHLVAITAGFTGTELLLFGSIQTEGDVVVVVSGPKQDVTVRRKDRVAGIWINRDSVEFTSVPSFYRVATTAQEGLDLPSSALRRHQIGIQNIRMRGPAGAMADQVDTFEEALLRNKTTVGHYDPIPGVVERRGGRLFRTSVLIPANVPIGTYTVETLLVQDGRVISAQTTPLFVNKEGFSAQIFRQAHLHPMLYGIVAIFLAGFAGLAANWAFRKI